MEDPGVKCGEKNNNKLKVLYAFHTFLAQEISQPLAPFAWSIRKCPINASIIYGRMCLKNDALSSIHIKKLSRNLDWIWCENPIEEKVNSTAKSLNHEKEQLFLLKIFTVAHRIALMEFPPWLKSLLYHLPHTLVPIPQTILICTNWRQVHLDQRLCSV